MWKIPLFDPDIGADELSAVTEPISDKWLAQGKRTAEFEQTFAEMLQVPYAVAVNSGTAALHLAMLLADIGPGDEVIVPSLTFVATANAVRYTGAVPVFADIESEEDPTISAKTIESKISPRTKGIIVVHYAGFSCRMESILQLAERKGLVVVEDAAHAVFTRESERYCGTSGVCGCFSFYSNKNITTGEGGMLVTSSAEAAERARRLRTHAMTTGTAERHRGSALSYDVTELGWNYRLDDVRASLGIAQLRRLPELLRRRRELRRLYVELLSSVQEIQIPFRDRFGEIGYHILPILLDQEINRDETRRRLNDLGIQTSVHYPPIHLFEAYEKQQSVDLPLTESVAAREITLPFFPSMTEEMAEQVVDCLKRAIA